MNVFVESGTVSIEYEYSAVPLPAAAWLFVSALIGGGMLRRVTRKA